MPWPTRFIECINVVCTLFSMSQPVVGRAFTPQDTPASAAIARHVCVPATPDVSKSTVRFLQQTIVRSVLIRIRSLPTLAIRLLPMSPSPVLTKCERSGQLAELRSCADDGRLGRDISSNLSPKLVASTFVFSPTVWCPTMSVLRLARILSMATKTAVITRQSSLKFVSYIHGLMRPQNASLRLLWLLLYRPVVTSRLRQQTTPERGSRYRNGRDDRRVYHYRNDGLGRRPQCCKR